MQHGTQAAKAEPMTSAELLPVVFNTAKFAVVDGDPATTSTPAATPVALRIWSHSTEFALGSHDALELNMASSK
jgi:hypothetical protein